MLFFALMQNILLYVIQFGVVLFAISIHEAAHAWTANYFGDPTARMQGRVTLNPVAHIDPVGTILFPLILILMGAPVFGWAKPVMVNPYNLRDPRKNNMIISAAGPAANILTALAGIVIFTIFQRIGAINLYQGGLLVTFLISLILISIFLAIFNLIPIPPLDGSGIIEGILEGEALQAYQRIRPYGFIILLVLIWAGVLDIIARPIIQFVWAILRG